MWRLVPFMLFALLTILAKPAFSENEANNSSSMLLPQLHQLYLAEPLASYVNPVFPHSNPKLFLNTLTPTQATNRMGGGAYWLSITLEAARANERWLFLSKDAVVNKVGIAVYDSDGQRIQNISNTGFKLLTLHYGERLYLPKGQPVHLLIYVQGEYFSGENNFQMLPESSYLTEYGISNMLTIACLGAIAILSIYNLFLGLWTRDKSYLFYSAYLFLSAWGWAASFNILSYSLGISSYEAIYPAFYVAIALSCLYIIHFLDLKQHSPWLVYGLYALAAVSGVIPLAIDWFSPRVFLITFYVFADVWIILGLYAGIFRLQQGYKPARFFVAAFVLFFVGALISVVEFVVGEIIINNRHLVILIGQTFDCLLLALAIADRINILKVQKEQALNHSLSTKVWAVEKEHEANEKLKQALGISEQESRRKSDFLRMVSHELRTPLYSVISSIEQWDDVDDSRGCRDLLHYMGYGAARLRMQVDNLVLLAETDDEHLEPNETNFEIMAVFDRLCNNVDGLLCEGVDFNFHCDADVPRIVKADRYLFENMLRTVLENACKYTEQGGVSFHVMWDEGALDLLITDTGCGMTREQERSMFNDFVQVSRGLDRKSEGLGIGLTVCYRLSEVLGADFTINSKLGEGTQVLIRQPIKELSGVCGLVDNAVMGGLTDSEKEGFQGETLVSNLSEGRATSNDDLERVNFNVEVLIVEDNVVNAKILQRLVEVTGGCAVIAESGQDALSQLQTRTFDIILMDVQMPVMDGITATRWIRRRGIETPIVAVTANSDAQVRKRCIEVGMNEFFVKPLRRADIEQILKTQLIEKES